MCSDALNFVHWHWHQIPALTLISQIQSAPWIMEVVIKEIKCETGMEHKKEENGGVNVEKSTVENLYIFQIFQMSLHCWMMISLLTMLEKQPTDF